MELLVICGKCDAEYKIPQEKFKGPSRFKCKTCGQEIFLLPDGDDVKITGGWSKSPFETSTPKRLGKFHDLERIAGGGMGEIYLAKMGGAEGFEREVVLKVLHPHLARDEDFAKAMVDEAKITVLLNHPNIVQVFNLEKTGDLLYCVMEFVSGMSLAEVQRKYRRKGGTISVPMAIYIIAEALEGLFYAHNLKDRQGDSLEIVHRDISPHNIMVTEDARVKIIDFGIAKAASRMSQTRPGTIKGKFAYMAPEQLRGASDHRVDLFAMGVVLWETIAGVRLFHSSTDVDTLQKVLHLEPPALSMSRPEIPRNLDVILNKSLAKNPEERYQTARQFKAALLEFVAPTTIDQLRDTVDIEAACLGEGAAGPGEDVDFETTPAVGTDMFDAKTRADAIPMPSAPVGPQSKSRAWLWTGLSVILLGGLGAGAWWGLGLKDHFMDGNTDAGVIAVPTGVDGGDGGPGDGAQTAMLGDGGKDAGRVRPRPIKLTRAVVKKVLLRHGAQLQRCADDHIAKLRAKRDVKIVLEFSIAASGRVQDAKVSPAKYKSTAFGRCLAKRVRRLKFPRHKGPTMEIGFPLTFQVEK